MSLYSFSHGVRDPRHILNRIEIGGLQHIVHKKFQKKRPPIMSNRRLSQIIFDLQLDYVKDLANANSCGEIWLLTMTYTWQIQEIVFIGYGVKSFWNDVTDLLHCTDE